MPPILPDTLTRVFIASFPAGPWQTNCYLVATAAGEECVIVDPGMDAAPTVAEVIVEHGLKPVAVLLTHGHLDHTFSVTPLCAEYASSAWIHSLDRELLVDPLKAMSEDTRQLLARLGLPERMTEPDDVHELTDGATVPIAGLEFRVDHAPGHTKGSVLFRTDYPLDDDVEEVVFSGDVLFAGSIGRTDLPGGSTADMLDSLRAKVATLPASAVVLPGHGPQTTMARELATNPYLQHLDRSSL
ncbi:MBL fold metallo-hydrolase [Microlunatus ginsengisoli]|uniref:MBL fold metallo-hydrolase n=1 Tax=Microlunatus ginsengisoli TaxID=363863 RepID=A0ABP6ZCX6_9ACTN